MSSRSVVHLFVLISLLASLVPVPGTVRADTQISAPPGADEASPVAAVQAPELESPLPPPEPAPEPQPGDSFELRLIPEPGIADPGDEAPMGQRLRRRARTDMGPVAPGGLQDRDRGGAGRSSWRDPNANLDGADRLRRVRVRRPLPRHGAGPKGLLKSSLSSVPRRHGLGNSA